MQNIKSKQKYTKSGLLRYFLKGSVFLFVICIAASLILTFLNTVIPKIISFTIDSVLDSEPVPTVYAPIVTALGGIDNIKQNIWIVAVIIAVIALVMLVFR